MHRRDVGINTQVNLTIIGQLTDLFTILAHEQGSANPVVTPRFQIYAHPQHGSHGCGGCQLFCPVEAISEEKREVGVVEVGRAKGFAFAQGRLRIGEAMSPPLIKAVKKAANKADLVIIDAPPGTSCPVIESIRDSDFVMLVTEPTPFGLNDLKLAVEMVRALELPFGVVINRADVGDDKVQLYCSDNGIRILEEIPDDRRIAEAYSRGRMICQALPEYESLFAGLLSKVAQGVKARAG